MPEHLIRYPVRSPLARPRLQLQRGSAPNCPPCHPLISYRPSSLPCYFCIIFFIQLCIWYDARKNRCHHFHSATTTPSRHGNNANGTDGELLYWSRETRKPTAAAFGSVAINKEARILALGDPADPNNKPLYDGPLPQGARLLKVGASLSDFDQVAQHEHPNVIFVSHHRPDEQRDTLVKLLDKFPSVEWVHSRSTGVDSIASPGLFASPVLLTTGRGVFSHTLAEHCMMACLYFAKDLPRLMRQKDEKRWEPYPSSELRGSTLGVVGYGHVGRASARLAKAYGMKVLGMKRKKDDGDNVRSLESSHGDDPYCDRVVYGTEGLHDLMSESDYILISAPLTNWTRGMISAEALSKCKPSTVIINVGRGPIINEEALIVALQNGIIRGAALDVTAAMPLPRESQLWKMENVLLSPHSAAMTRTYVKDSVEFFVWENLSRFVRSKPLLNHVDKVAGY